MRGMLKFKSVRSRLTFWFMMVATLPLLIFFGVVYEMRVEKVKEKGLDKLSAIRDLKTEQINGWLDESSANLGNIAGIHQFRRLLEEFHNNREYVPDPTVLESVKRRLEQYSSSGLPFAELSILHPETGLVLTSSSKTCEGENRSRETYFQEALHTGHPYIQDVSYSIAEHRATLTAAAPIRCLKHNNEHVIGVLMARIDLNHSLYKLLQLRTGLGMTGETFLVNRDGLVLSDLRWHEDAILKLKLPTQPVLHAINGNTGTVEAYDYRGERVLAAYTHIPRLGWGFVTKQDLLEVSSEIREMTVHMVSLLFLSIMGVFGIGFLVAKSIAKPVIDMAQVSEAIESGDFSARNTVQSPDELGYLAKTFNGMAESVQKQLVMLHGIGELNQAMMAARDLNQFYLLLLEKLMAMTDSEQGACFKYIPDGNRFDPAASVGVSSQLLEPFSEEHREGQFGIALTTKQIYHATIIPEDTAFIFKTFVGTALPRAIITMPIVVKDRVHLMISLASLAGYSEYQLKIVEHVSTSIATALSNLTANEEMARLAEELQSRNTELKAQADELFIQAKELEQQSAELHQQNVELDMQRAQVEEASRLKSTFLSNMSHELRTPLNSVMALSKVLMMDEEGKFSEEELGYLEIIERNGKKLLSLINDILDLSKIEAGKVDLNVDSLSSVAVIRNVLERLQPIAEAKGLDLIRDIPQDLPEIESDEARLDQILQNIIGNAVKFTDGGSITVSASYDENRIHIRVTDTGIGIMESELPHIFEEFRQVDGSPSRRHEGTGLGLAIAGKTAGLLKGELHAESSYGEGSTFTLSLPRRWSGEVIPHEPFVLKGPSRGEPRKQPVLLPSGESESQAPSRQRILMVEDNETAVIQVKAVLEREGYIVDVAAGGKEAIDYVQHTIPDGIILDLMMPEIDGFQVLEQIRSAKATATIPVLVLTAKDLSSKDLSKLSANHIQQLVQKGDVDAEHLLFKIGLMLGGKPKQLVSSEANRVDALRPTEKPRTIRKPADPKSGSPKILIVEDNPDNMATIRAILKSQYTLVEATDGEEGLEKTLSELPDLILLDMALPKMDGFAVLRELKAHEKTLSIPIIALTARAMKGDKEQILQAGFDDYISKPVEPKELVEKIRESVNR